MTEYDVHKETRLTREELYQLVWAEPMREVAKRYGITDVALAKRCRKMNIPVPGRGYWARRQHGHNTGPQPPLPKWQKPVTTNIVIRKRKVEAPSPVVEDDEGQKLITFEKDPANTIVVKEALRNPHLLVAQTQTNLKGMKPDDNGLLVTSFKKGLEMHVSHQSSGRALRIMDALLKAFEVRGYSVSIREEDRRWRTYVQVLGEDIGFGVWEACEHYEKELTAAEKREREKHPWLHNHVFLRPKGELSLRTWDDYGTRKRDGWTDSDKRKLEERLNLFVIGLVKLAFKQKVERAEKERRELEWAERRRRAEESERQRYEEQQRLDHLDKEILSWHKSRLITDYANAVRKAVELQGGTVSPDTELGKWLAWTQAVAQRLDSSAKKAQDLLSMTESGGQDDS